MFFLISALVSGMPAQGQGSPTPGADYYAASQGSRAAAAQAPPYSNPVPTPGAVSISSPNNSGVSVSQYGGSQYSGTSNQGAYVGGSSPLPGSSAVYQSRPAQSADKPGSGGRAGMYQTLPISLDEAKLRIEELRNLVAVSRPQDVQDKVYAFCEWLVDMTEAHNRLSNVFSKQDSLKAQAQAEKNTAQKFAHLKNEATLLKAEVLIKQNRIPEAIGPLVDIVVNEPKGSAGVAAYNRLKEIGFSDAAADINVPISVGTPSQSAPANQANLPDKPVVVSSVKAQMAAKPNKVATNKKPIPAAAANVGRVH
jgi:hypothetical protein